MRTVQKPIDQMTLDEARAALKRTRQVALRVSEEQGWCRDGVDDAFREIGIPAVGTGATSKLTYVFEIEHESDVELNLERIRSVLDDLLDGLPDNLDEDDPEVAVTIPEDFDSSLTTAKL